MIWLLLWPFNVGLLLCTKVLLCVFCSVEVSQLLTNLVLAVLVLAAPVLAYSGKYQIFELASASPLMSLTTVLMTLNCVYTVVNTIAYVFNSIYIYLIPLKLDGGTRTE